MTTRDGAYRVCLSTLYVAAAALVLVTFAPGLRLLPHAAPRAGPPRRLLAVEGGRLRRPQARRRRLLDDGPDAPLLGPQAGGGAAAAGPARPLAGRAHLPGRLRPAAGRAPQHLQGPGARGPELLVDGRSSPRAGSSAATCTCRSRARAPARSAPWRSSRRRTASSPSSCARASASTRPRSRGSTRSWRSRRAAGLLGGFVRLVTDDLRLRSGLRAFARSCRSVPAPVFADFERVVRQKAQVHRRILLWDRVHELFHYWHVLHKPFAARDVPLHDRARGGGPRHRLRVGGPVVSRARRRAGCLALALAAAAAAAPRSRPGP